MRLPISVAVIVAVSSGIELLLQAADYGWIFSKDLRWHAYQYGGFWSGLLFDWAPNYPYQAMTMFASYALFHGGLVHLGFNMLAFISLSGTMIARVGELRFLVIYEASIVGGAAVFGLLSKAPQPMVGASGGLFGLAGAYVVWNCQDLSESGEAISPVIRLVGYLIAFNIISFWFTDGQLAWQTHLGGFIAGALMGVVWSGSNAKN